MSSSDRVAVIALVVSLVALCVTTLQLLQQLLGTAEGYRRCGASVIGPWANLRRRKFSWTEFRFEVQYLTPHLTVLSSDHKDWNRARRVYGPAYNLTLLPKGNTTQDRSYIQALDKTVSAPMEDVDDGTYTEDRKLLARMRDLKPLRLGSQHDSERQIHTTMIRRYKSMDDTPKPKGEIRVTWMQLLRELHHTYQGFYPDRSTTLPKTAGRTDACVAIRQWTWDFMPPDLLRPLATVSLNNIILLALRLNMQWRRLDFENGVFLADGNGYSLTSVEMRNLGIAFHFSVRGSQHNSRKYIPNEAVDKMMFGIIPGCPDLVKTDFGLVAQTRRIESWPPNSLLQDIGIDNSRYRNEITKTNWHEPHNDLVILLCSFLPLSGCPVVYHCFPGWLGEPHTTPLHYFEGRLALVEALEERLSNSPDHRARATLEDVWKIFQNLQQDWRDDFFDRFDKSAIEGFDNQRKLDLSEACRKIFNWTTSFFQGRRLELPIPTGKDRPNHASLEKGSREGTSGLSSQLGPIHDWTESPEGRTRYVDLVAGHTVMASYAVSSVMSNLQERKEKYPGGIKRRLKHRQIFHYDRRDAGMHNQYHIAMEYVSFFNHEDYGVVKHLRGKEVDWSVEDIEAAWWVLMLRGIVWNMPTTGNSRVSKRPGCWEGEPVPSSFYYAKTPVWIT